MIALIIDAHHSAWQDRKKDQFASNIPGSVAVKQTPTSWSARRPSCDVRRPDMFSLHDVDKTRTSPQAYANESGRTLRFRKNDRRYRQSGGARRDRTDDLMLAKHALSQLSYSPVGRRSSGRGEASQARRAAAPRGAVSLRRRMSPPAFEAPRTMVGLGRLERPTSPLSGVRSNHLSYRPEPVDRAAAAIRGCRSSVPLVRMFEKGKRGRRRLRQMGP